MNKDHGGLLLKRVPVDELDFQAANRTLAALTEMLEDGTRLNTQLLAELVAFQAEDGSFRFTDSWRMPAEARIDFGYRPTYVAAAILVREYLLAEPRMPRKTIATALGKALACSTGRGLRGHGYGAEQGVLSTLKLFKTGGLREFLVKGQHICPEFHALVWDIFDEREAMLAAEGGGRIEGPWGADYTEEWLELLGEIRPDKRIYLAYGSNMSSEQMRERCPEAELIGSTYLENWSLAFYEYATIEEKEGAKTPVVIWQIGPDDEQALNSYEGFPKHYYKRNFVVSHNGTRLAAMAYLMTDWKKSQAATSPEPSEAYLERIRRGYREAGFREEI